MTSIVFDGETRSITTTDVACTKQLNGGLVILVQDTPTRTVRVQLTQQGRLVVQKAGLRYDDMAGFVADSREVTATKVDDTFTFGGRMPPNSGGVAVAHLQDPDHLPRISGCAAAHGRRLQRSTVTPRCSPTSSPPDRDAHH